MADAHRVGRRSPATRRSRRVLVGGRGGRGRSVARGRSGGGRCRCDRDVRCVAVWRSPLAWSDGCCDRRLPTKASTPKTARTTTTTVGALDAAVGLHGVEPAVRARWARSLRAIGLHRRLGTSADGRRRRELLVWATRSSRPGPAPARSGDRVAVSLPVMWTDGVSLATRLHRRLSVGSGRDRRRPPPGSERCSRVPSG